MSVLEPKNAKNDVFSAEKVIFGVFSKHFIFGSSKEMALSVVNCKDGAASAIFFEDHTHLMLQFIST